MGAWWWGRVEEHTAALILLPEQTEHNPFTLGVDEMADWQSPLNVVGLLQARDRQIMKPL